MGNRALNVGSESRWYLWGREALYGKLVALEAEDVFIQVCIDVAYRRKSQRLALGVALLLAT
eukprot:6148023-Karenia_brevis.AAC.1